MNLKVLTNIDPPAAVSLEDAFREFWKIYPRREGKAVAKAKFMQICRPQGLATRTTCRDSGQIIFLEHQATAQEIIEGAKRFRKKFIDPRKCRVDDYDNPVFNENLQFCPHAATWLNRGQWEDE